jgi:hypothetical protein
MIGTRDQAAFRRSLDELVHLIRRLRCYTVRDPSYAVLYRRRSAIGLFIPRPDRVSIAAAAQLVQPAASPPTAFPQSPIASPLPATAPRPIIIPQAATQSTVVLQPLASPSAAAFQPVAPQPTTAPDVPQRQQHARPLE